MTINQVTLKIQQRLDELRLIPVRYIKYQQLPDTNHTIKPKDLSKAKAQRRFEIQSDAYHIFNAQTYKEATIQQFQIQNF